MVGGSSSTDAKHFPNGKSPGRKAGRPKPLKRRSLHGSGDSTPRIQSPTDTKPKEKEMAASFLQYCAMCEKQIMTPCNSILYCSEACRRKDSAKPLSASSIASPPQAASTPLTPHHTTIALRTSSASPPPVHATPALRIPADIHDAKSDLDPTEWKPKLQRRTNSEAFQYLSRFNLTMNGSGSVFTSETESHHTVQPRKPERPANVRHKSTASMSMSTSGMTTPSLGNTPTTTASSFDSFYYDFNLRPLPPRQNPLYSTNAGTYKGIDLVTPHIPPPVVNVDGYVADVTHDLDFWGKKLVVPGSTPQGNGLGALFGKDQ
ncbi:hypothetical protein A1O1_04033 [Capronia coronata CBS 617.96]|uniref:Uncharacterized protein n=1 Tax=Capronia coronata CBS 617.96 TaxID=1182541 RepID=W9YDI8_9EURO|nr:uncharacterized protein A1O1_04033 [Capronia coronata CBS 617.96]EXJ90927.1 hypothetical protein A1O1_04033 [Capronia coronata CBS 617.96]